MSKSSDTEGLIISVGVVLIMLCLAGSLATGLGPVDFFFISVGISAVVFFVGGGLLIGGFAIYKALADTKVDDGRPFWKRLIQDYSWQTLVNDAKTAMEHIKLAIREKRSGGPQGD